MYLLRPAMDVRCSALTSSPLMMHMETSIDMDRHGMRAIHCVRQVDGIMTAKTLNGNADLVLRSHACSCQGLITDVTPDAWECMQWHEDCRRASRQKCTAALRTGAL